GKAKLPKASQEAAESVANAAAEAMEKIAEEEEDVINLDDFEDLYEKYQPDTYGWDNTIEDVKNHSRLLEHVTTHDEREAVYYYTASTGYRELQRALRFPGLEGDTSERRKK